MLREAWRLLISRLVEALLVEPNSQDRSCLLSPILQRFRVSLGGNFDFCKVGIKAHPVEACRLQILRRPDKDPGSALYRIPQCAEVAACSGGKKHDGLLGFLGNGDEDSLFACLFCPGIHARKPFGRRGVGGAAEEGNDQHKSRGLAFRKIRMDPQTVAGKEVGHLANGQSDLSPFHVHIDFGPDQVERRSGLTWCRCTSQSQHNEGEQKKETTPHHSIVRRRMPLKILPARKTFD